jgi:hypothetical protein
VDFSFFSSFFGTLVRKARTKKGGRLEDENFAEKIPVVRTTAKWKIKESVAGGLAWA